MEAACPPTVLVAALLILAVSSELFDRIAADNAPECPYPCLPPPTSGITNLPPPPPSETALPYPPPPPQAYTPGWLPPPSVSVYQPGLVFPAPPPPNAIMPYFPFYFRTPNAAHVLDGGHLWLAMALSSSMLAHLLLH